jgi:transposase
MGAMEMAGHEPIQVHLRRGARRHLKRRMQDCKDADLRVRYNIVLLYAEHRGTQEIAATLGCSDSTAIRAANRFLTEGEAGLFDRRTENGERKVDDDMVAALVELVRATPQTYGWARPTWTTELLALTLSEATHTQVSATTVRRMLHALHARWGMPRATVLCTWPKRKKNKRIRELEALVEELPEDEELLYQDELDVHLNPKIGRDWMLPNEQKVVITPGNNVKRCVAGGLNPKSGSIVWVVGERRNADLFLEFLRRVRSTYPNAKKIHLIVDNCKAHSCQKVQKALEKEFEGGIVLHFLPPYSPEHNPIERLWKEVHANVTRNHRCRTIEELLANVDHFLDQAQPYPGAQPSLAKLTKSSVA